MTTLDADVRLVVSIPELSVRMQETCLRVVVAGYRLAVKEAPGSPYDDGVRLGEHVVVRMSGRGVGDVGGHPINTVPIG